MATKPSRKEQILSAAARLIAEKGFHNVTLAEIGREVGISGPALYRHFEGKDAILGAILVSISEQLLQGAVDLGESTSDPTDLARALVRAHVDFAVSRPELIVLQWREFHNLKGDDRRTVRRLQRTYIDYWVAVLLRLDPRLTIPVAGATVVAAFGLMNSTPFSASRLAPDEVRPLLVGLASGCLGV